jgi:hypothetical protein
VGLTVIYYVLLSVPLQIMQYYQYTVLTIARSDWWLEAGSSPPLLVPLTSIAGDLTSSMSQFASTIHPKPSTRLWANHVVQIDRRTISDAQHSI